MADLTGQFGLYKKVVFSDEWMGDSYITVTYEGNEPFYGAAGSIDYEGEMFTQRTPPTIVHQNDQAVNSYETIYRYYSVRDELERARFLDVVPAENGAVYSALPDFSFYCTGVETLLERIAANMRRAGFGGWSFSGSGFGADFNPDETSKCVVSVNNISCWDALALVKSQFGLNFFISGRTVVVGDQPISAAPCGDLHYGPGKGLYREETGYDDSQYLVTKLYAFGNTTNMPNHYYMNLNLKCYITKDNEYTVTIPEEPKEKYEEPEMPSDYNAMLKPGDEGYEDWYNRVQRYASDKQKYDEWMKSEERVALFAAYEDACAAIEDPETGPGIPREDFELLRDVMEMTGTDTFWTSADGLMPSNFTNYHYAECFATFKIDRVKAYMFYSRGAKKCYIFASGEGEVTAGANKSTWPNIKGTRFPNNMNCNRLMLPGFGKHINESDPNSQIIFDVYIENGELHQGTETWTDTTTGSSSAGAVDNGLHEATVVFDGSDGLPDIHPSLKYLLDENGNPLDRVVGADNGDIGIGVVDEGKTVPNFSIFIPDIGFDISDYVAQTPTITMQTGGCAGRSFEILDVKESNGGYELRCKRVGDNDIYYPNTMFMVAAGDKFVLTGIYMPDVFVEAASQELLRQAKIYLQDNNEYVKKGSMEIDPIYMAKRGGAPGLRAGQGMNDSIIDHLTITWEPNSLPKYDIQLSDSKTVSMLQRKLNSSKGIATGGSGESFGNNTYGYIQPSVYGTAQGGQYLSRIKADSARGRITFNGGATLNGQNILGPKGLKSKNYSAETGMGIYQDPTTGLWYINTDCLNVRYKMTARELEIQKVSHIGGQLMLSAAYGTIDHVTDDENGLVVYFKASDDDGNTVDNLWRPGDIFYCQTFDLKKDEATGLYTNRVYKYTIESVGQANGFNTVKLYKDGQYGPWRFVTTDEEAELGTLPAEGDKVVQCGNAFGEPNRTSVMVIAGAGVGSPYIYMFKNVTNYELTKPFIKLDDNPELTLNSLQIGVTDVGSALEDAFEVYQLDVYAPRKEGELLEGESPFADNIIGLEGWPDVEESWGELDTYEMHERDVAITKDGVYYRFVIEQGTANTYNWELISDTYLIQAIQKAEDAMSEIEEMASDGVISAVEKKSLWVEFKNMQSQMTAIEKEIGERFSEDSNVGTAFQDYAMVYDAIEVFFITVLALNKESGREQNTFIGDKTIHFSDKCYSGNTWVKGERYEFAKAMGFYYEAYCNVRKEITISSLDILGNLQFNLSDEELAKQIDLRLSDLRTRITSAEQSLLVMENDFASLSTWAKDGQGGDWGSGLLTEAWASSLFTVAYNAFGGETVKSTISTYLFDATEDEEYDDEGNFVRRVLKSGIKMKADQIDFEGNVTFKANLEDYLGLGWIRQMYGNLITEEERENIPDEPEGLRKEIIDYLFPAEGDEPKVGDLLKEFLKKRILANVCGSDLDRLAKLIGDEDLYKYISGQTTIVGGFINTELLNVKKILGEDAVFSGKLEAASGTFDGSLIVSFASIEGTKELKELYDSIWEEKYQPMIDSGDASEYDPTLDWNCRNDVLAIAINIYDKLSVRSGGYGFPPDKITLPMGVENAGRQITVYTNGPAGRSSGAVIECNDLLDGIPAEYTSSGSTFARIRSISFFGGTVSFMCVPVEYDTNEEGELIVKDVCWTLSGHSCRSLTATEE